MSKSEKDWQPGDGADHRFGRREQNKKTTAPVEYFFILKYDDTAYMRLDRWNTYELYFSSHFELLPAETRSETSAERRLILWRESTQSHKSFRSFHFVIIHHDRGFLSMSNRAWLHKTGRSSDGAGGRESANEVGILFYDRQIVKQRRFAGRTDSRPTNYMLGEFTIS